MLPLLCTTKKKKKKEQQSHLWHIQTTDFYEVVKKNEVDLYGLIWKDMYDILLMSTKSCTIRKYDLHFGKN